MSLVFSTHLPALADMTEAAPSAATEEQVQVSQAAPSIVDIAVSSGAFNTLVAALEAAELVEALSGDGPLTVFAPLDEAFAALPDGVLDALLLPENKDLLTQILTYHVVDGQVLSSDLSTGDVTTLGGEDVAIAVSPDEVKVNDATVLRADVEGSNGVIHVIDQVLVPEAVGQELATRMAAAENAAAPAEEPMAEPMAEEPMAEPMADDVMMDDTMDNGDEVEMAQPAVSAPVRGLW